MWRAPLVVAVLVLAGCFGGSGSSPEVESPQSSTGSSTSPPEPEGPLDSGQVTDQPPVSPRAVKLATPVRPEGASAAFVWKLPAGFVSPALHRPDGDHVYFEGAIMAPEGLTAWVLYVFDLTDTATPVGVVASPTLTAADGAGASQELGPSEHPFYFHLDPSQITDGRLGLWLAGQGTSDELGMVLRLLDHDPGFMYIGTGGLAEPPAADSSALLARIGSLPKLLPVRAEFGAWDLEVLFESDSFPENAMWRTSGVETTQDGSGAVEVSAHHASLGSRDGWGDAMAGLVRVAGAEQWDVEATVHGRSEDASQVAPFTGLPEEWPFMRSSHEGEGESTLTTTVTGVASPGVRRSVFSLWSSTGTSEAAFGVPFAAPAGGRSDAPAFGQGLGADGALRVVSSEGPVLSIPDAGRGLGIDVPIPDNETEARAADNPSSDTRPIQVIEETITVHLTLDTYVEGGSTGFNNENCVTLDLTYTRLLGVRATATWTPAGANPDKLSLVTRTGPYHGFDAVYGPSPLIIDYAGGEIPRASTVLIGVQSMDTQREDVSAAAVVDQDVTLVLEMTYQGDEPVIDELRLNCGISGS